MRVGLLRNASWHSYTAPDLPLRRRESPERASKCELAPLHRTERSSATTVGLLSALLILSAGRSRPARRAEPLSTLNSRLYFACE